MVTIAETPEPPKGTKEDVAERAAALREDALRASRSLLTGDVNGRSRRNLLFIVTAFLIVIGSPLALLPLLLLALTDMVVI